MANRELRASGYGPSGDATAGEDFADSESLNPPVARRIAVTLNQFSFFAAAARHRNLTKASAELRVSQPSVSQQLKQLEERYGVKIYRRVSKGVEITEAGQGLLRMIIPILEQVARVEAGFKKTAAANAPELLAVGGTYSASAILLPRLLACLGKRHPKAELELQTNTSDQLERSVLSAATRPRHYRSEIVEGSEQRTAAARRGGHIRSSRTPSGAPGGSEPFGTVGRAAHHTRWQGHLGDDRKDISPLGRAGLARQHCFALRRSRGNKSGGASGNGSRRRFRGCHKGRLRRRRIQMPKRARPNA
jgi:DNA-binding MarR family transcriptional regulator